ncbi:MAG TPA: family 1 glycosylhydrolase, partial [Chloroflexota bacterium]|nr:family 1 glycosylhydrolase [Chloroflexota bacterium]
MNPKPFALPEGFRFGVATAGFQVEGGYNGPREPRNNWYWWEKAGRVEPSGIALDFWNRYEAQLDLAKDVGCDSFRLSVEWARCEPSKGKIDKAAFKRYSAILKASHDRGMEPLVTLHHFTHPEWLGMD